MPLMWKDKICQLSDHQILIIKSTKGTHIIETENNENCDYQKTSLCLIPRYNSASSIASRCASYLLNTTNISLLKQHCEFHCYDAPNHILVKQLSINTFLLTNIQTDIHILCSTSNNTRTISKIDIGTLEIRLPCDCQLLEEQEILIHPITPCDARDFSSPVVYHLIPLPWTNLDNMKIDPLDKTDRTEFYNVTNFVLPDWHLKTPTFVVTHKEPVKLFDHITPNNSWLDIMNDRRLMIYVLFAWITILTILLIMTLYCTHILYIKLQAFAPALPPRDH